MNLGKEIVNLILEKDVKKKETPGRVLWVRKKRRISN